MTNQLKHVIVVAKVAIGRRRPTAAVMAGLALATLLGCDPSGGRVNAPNLNPPAMAQAALTEFDTNKDQSLDADELSACPGLKRNLATIDTNKDGKLTAEEIATRLQSFTDVNIGLVGFSARFTLDGQPLDSARVVLTPEKFLASAVKPAECTTTPEGIGFFQVGPNLPGVQPGIYRLEVYRQAAGQESIPARYNEQTTLGVETGVDGPDVNSRPHFALTSK